MNVIIESFDVIIFVAILSPFLFLLTRRLAITFLLLDTPNTRKLHKDQTPLTGGISIFLISFLTYFLFETISINVLSFFVCGFCILCLGVIDDKFDLPARIKLFFQTLIALIFVIITKYEINDLGTPLGFSSSLELGLLSFPFTLFSIVGLTNAYNMIDGCDGLAPSLMIISLLALLIFQTTGWNDSNKFFLILVSCLIIFLFFNFSKIKSIKIFLGDGGSLFIGFIIATSLVKFVNENTLYDSSIVLWFSALVIFDFAAVIVIRKLLKRKMFAADRNHIHHFLLSCGFSHVHTTALISAAAVVLVLFGVIITKNYPSLSFWSFGALFLIYLSFRIFTRKAE